MADHIYLDPTRLTLPFGVENAPSLRTDSLEDLFLRVGDLLTLVGMGLLYINDLEPRDDARTAATELVIEHAYQDPTTGPSVHLAHGWGDAERDNFLRSLFHSGVVQLATAYEVYLGELVEELYRDVPSLLPTPARQFTAEHLFQFESIDAFRDHLVDAEVMELAMMSYPKLVSAFERRFHIGIHSGRGAPTQMQELHAFLELRHVVVHGAGHASSRYVQRTAGYTEKGLENILGPGEQSPVDFKWLVHCADLVLQTAHHVDGQAIARGISSGTAEPS